MTPERRFRFAPLVVFAVILVAGAAGSVVAHATTLPLDASQVGEVVPSPSLPASTAPPPALDLDRVEDEARDPVARLADEPAAGLRPSLPPVDIGDVTTDAVPGLAGPDAASGQPGDAGSSPSGRAAGTDGRTPAADGTRAAQRSVLPRPVAPFLQPPAAFAAATNAAVSRAAGRALQLAGPLAVPLVLGVAGIAFLLALSGPDHLVKAERAPLRRWYRL